MFCDDCIYLQVTEAEQQAFKKHKRNCYKAITHIPKHYCKKYKKEVRHLGFKPHILKLNECKGAMRNEV